MYVIARTARQRPSLMHKLSTTGRTTMCGVSLMGWSCAYFDTAIPQVECIRCKGR